MTKEEEHDLQVKVLEILGPEVLGIKENITKVLSQIKREFTSMCSEFKNYIAQSNGSLKKCINEIEQHEKFLKQLARTNENVEETLINVLQAIRQNELLQAWSPPQKGYSETKIVGLHPLKVKQNIERAKNV